MRIYEYIKNGGTFWDNSYIYPTSISTTVRENVTNTIKYRFAFHKMRKTLEVMTSNYNVELSVLVQSIIYSIMNTNEYKYNTLYSTLNLDYNPIENYRVTENEATSGTHSDTEAHSGTHSDTDTHSGTDTHTISNRIQDSGNSSTQFQTTSTTTNTNNSFTDNNITSTDSVFAFNSGSWEQDKKNVTDNDTNVTGNETSQQDSSDTTTELHSTVSENNGTDTLQHGETINNNGSHSETINNNGSHSENKTLTRSGNIGVTTSQQMIQSEREIALFNFVDIVTSDIIKEICVNVI